MRNCFIGQGIADCIDVLLLIWRSN